MTDAHTHTSLPPQGDALTTDERLMPVLVHALFLLGWVSGGLTSVIGLVIAYVSLSENGWRHSHHVQAIHTFWLTLAGLAVAGALVGVGALFIVMILGIPLGVPMVVIGGLLLLAVPVWATVRSVVALIHAARGEAHPRPRALFM